MNLDIRLADRLAQMLEQIQELDQRKAALKESMRLLCETAEPSEAEIAEVYWKLEAVPASFLGPLTQVTRIAREHPYWSWRCVACSDEVFITSRSDKKARERRAACWWECQACRKSAEAGRNAIWHEEAKERAQREQALRTMPYREYLQTPEWQERRAAALKRSAYRCQVCNRSRPLHVHHRTYERRGVELARDLIALCDQCHALYHGKGLLADDPQGVA